MKNLLGISAAVLGLLAMSGTSQAQLITWGAAQNMTGNTDISTAGTYYDAVTAGFSSITVNNGIGGVGGTNTLFNSPTGSPATDGTITITIGDDRGAFGGAFTTSSPSSASYSSLVNTGIFNAGGSSTVTIGGSLIVGDTYQVESWSYWTGDPSPDTTNYSGTGGLDSVSLLNGIGQFAIGTFVATASPETYQFTADGGHGFVNDVLVRDITVAAPEPSSAWLILAGFAGLGVYLRSKRSIQA